MSYFASDLGVGVGEAAVRSDDLLLDPLMVVALFGLGVGDGLVFAVRLSELLVDTLTVVACTGCDVEVGKHPDL